MDKKMETLLHDVERIRTIICRVEQQLDELHVTCSDRDTFLTMKEELSEVHTRLEGVQEFVLSCKKEAHRSPEDTEEFEVWL